jgi:hypothetical protein
VLPSFRIDDAPKIEERSLTVAAFEYTTTSAEKPGRQDFEELARVTAEVADVMYESFFDKIPEMDFGFMELHRYIALTPLLVEFKISSYFHRPSLIPSLTEVEDVASRGFVNGAEFYDLYLARLQEMKSSVFSGTTSFRFINTLDGLQEAQERTSSESQSSWWNNHIVKIVVPAAAGLVAFFLCIFCVRHYREYRRPLTFEELEALEAKSGSRDARSVSSNTYASDYRTSVFSDHTFDKDATLDPRLPVSEVRELSLEKELAQIMSELEEVSLGDHDEAGVYDSREPNEFLVTGLASSAKERKESSSGALSNLLSVDANASKKVEATSSQPAFSAQKKKPTLANVAAKDETVVRKAAGSPNGQEKPDWMTKKLKSVAEPPPFLEVTTVVETTPSKQKSSSSEPQEAPSVSTQEAPSVSQEEAIAEKTIAPTEFVAKVGIVVHKPPVLRDAEGKLAWATKKLKPTAKTPTIAVAATKADVNAANSQAGTAPSETQNPQPPIELAAKDESVVQQVAFSPDEERKPAWTTKKLKPIAKTPTNAVAATKVDAGATVSQPGTAPTETKNPSRPIELAATDESVVQQPAALPNEERMPAWTTKKLRPRARPPMIAVTSAKANGNSTKYQAGTTPTETQSPQPRTELAAKDDRVQQPTASSREERKPAWMTTKLKPLALPTTIDVTTETAATTSQPETLSTETQDPPISTGSVPSDERVTNQQAVSPDEEGKLVLMTNKLRPVAKTPMNVVATTKTPPETSLQRHQDPPASKETSSDDSAEAPTEVSTEAPAHEESVVKPEVSSVEEGKPAWMMMRTTFLVPASQNAGANKTMEASLVEEGQPARVKKEPTKPVAELEATQETGAKKTAAEWMKTKPTVPGLKAAQDSTAKQSAEASLVEEGQPGWMKNKPTATLAQLKAVQDAGANKTAEVSPAAPEWMRKFQEMGL